ncbi:MAG TPA: ABC transporter ATP-binding protein [Oligoflexus sp.]|uniref:ABC transporter ATP-binding protein n=1 Tax=Oligoflexus sp. TaxID=1971216 RepID=UPI002D2490A4|nr:ABC transporter ATP-binding protein [Oligoflexus sp.]HYX33395.1 ABC transporter ATP-binding protein [Oligoflexus sp.]
MMQIENLSIMMADAAGSVPIIEHLDLEIKPGEILGLAGESGCGKSTLAKALLRILPPPAYISSGRILYQGHDILDYDARAMKRFRWREAAMVFQNALNALNPVLRIREQLVDTLQAHRRLGKKEAVAIAAEWMVRVGLHVKHLEAYPHELSGGMRQRVMIAMALLLEAPLLILDEPTTALDVIVQREILQKIVELQDTQQFSVLFVTHDLPLMTAFCDRIAILYAGSIVECGQSQDIARAAQHPYTQGLMASFPSLDGQRLQKRGIAGYPPGFAAQRQGCAFLPRCPRPCAQGALRQPPLLSWTPGHQLACYQAGSAQNGIPKEYLSL